MTENNSTASAPFNIKIPGYQIKRLLGKGGMASVYLAVQESFGRNVAIKVLTPDMAEDKEFSQRFLREAQIVSRLQHPNIVTVYDVGIHEGYHYLSMEYIPGKELREAKYDISKTDAVRIIKEVAKALEYAHKQGYIHRDVKPENIMLHDNGEHVVLMDFGIARMTQVNISVTKTGKVIGTPHYMSPEQTKGLKVDHRSDIYSLGVVLFQLLSGRLPYDADSPVAVGIKHISDPIPTMPPGLEMFQPIINTCLSKNPEHRYQSAAELIEALDGLNMNAISALDARNSEQQAKDRVINDPDSATTIGSAILDNETFSASRSDRRGSAQPQYSIPPLVHPDPKKYQSEETETQEKPRSKILLIILLLLLGGSAWAYFNQPLVFKVWEEKLQPQVMRLAIQYNLIPEPETSIKEIQQPEQAIATPPVPEKDKTDVETKIEQTPVNEQQPAQTVNDPSVIASSDKPITETRQSEPVQQEVNKSLTASELQQLKATLSQQPENALKLAEHYKKALEKNPGNLAASNGQAELQEWYKHELGTAIENRDLPRARLLADQLQHSYPSVAEQPRFHRMITRLAQMETIQEHLDKGAQYLSKQVLTEPQGANALAEYQIVLALAPQHPEALQGIKKIRDIAYEKATYHYSRGELKKSLGFINAGLKASSKDKELLALKEKVSSRAERVTRHDTLNRQADVLFRSGNLIVPVGESAFDKYSQVLKENPNNLVARSGIRKIEKSLVEYAIIYLDENDLEKAEGLITAAREKFGPTPIIEEVQFRLDKAIKAAAPKVTNILFSASKPAALKDMVGQRLNLNKILYVGFAYENFKSLNTVIQANLLDNTGRILLTSKKVTLKNATGEHILDMTLPTAQLATGNYKLELLHGADRLIVGSFFNDNNLQ